MAVRCLFTDSCISPSDGRSTPRYSTWTVHHRCSTCPLLLPPFPSLPPPPLSYVDTRLFDLDCASSLLDLLHRGVVQLKRPGGQGVLRLYSDNVQLDEW